MLLKTKKYIKWGIRHYISQYAKPNNKYMTDNDKNKESPYIQYWEVNNWYISAISQYLPVNNFEWIKDAIQWNEYLIKTIMTKVMKAKSWCLVISSILTYIDINTNLKKQT